MGGILCPNLYIKHDESTPKRQSIVYHKYESDKLSEFSSNVFTLKKVTFSPIIETRNYDIDENNSNSVYYDDTQHNENFAKEEEVQCLSFENSETKFVIEDNFYKIKYKLPKNVDDLILVKQLDNNRLKINILKAIHNAQEITKSIQRLDAIILLDDKQLVLLTETFIFDFSYTNNCYKINRYIQISSIDYITLYRDGSRIILHIITEDKKNKNYILKHEKLEKVVACLASSYFFTHNKGILVNRHISVITIDPNFEISKNLEIISDFYDYNNVLIFNLDVYKFSYSKD